MEYLIIGFLSVTLLVLIILFVTMIQNANNLKTIQEDTAKRLENLEQKVHKHRTVIKKLYNNKWLSLVEEIMTNIKQAVNSIKNYLDNDLELDPMEAYVIIRELQDAYYNESLDLMKQEMELEEVDQILPQETKGAEEEETEEEEEDYSETVAEEEEAKPKVAEEKPKKKNHFDTMDDIDASEDDDWDDDEDDEEEEEPAKKAKPKKK